ncbi:MAG: prepilin-type N-terminal cleavage/methylation domain-containing protein [Bacilli bacterium]|nr:prepilin-type N-terminal cleavage/methylation domain-containing protein [Bacilli bacterium]
MLKKIKGFSLVELIIAIALLASIGLLIGLNFNKIFNKEEKGSYEEYVNNIKSAADLYLSSNNSLLTELNTNKGYIIITIKQIKEAGLLSSDLINPTTKEPVLDDELVTVSLDANGLYKFTYPGVKKEEYLQTITKTIDYGKEFNCLSDLDTINLGLIDKNGNLKINYFNNSPSYISCDKETIDTKEIGNHVITYNYVNSEGVTKEAKRNFVVIDHISPTVTSVDYSPKGWTKGDVTISANINDNESGIGYYTINLNKCDNFKKTNANSITEVISQNGQYSVCAKDISGNVTESKLTISNIDKTLPVINNIKQFTVGLGITATIADNQSKVVAYAINQTSNESSVTWTNISATASTNISKAVAKIGTYYIWAKDLAGNVSKKSFVVVDNIKPTVTNVKATPTAWTKGNVTISASISDNESGIASYAINLNSCGTYTSTTAATISKTVSANGTYSVCAKDVAGNVTENKITISNIDKTLPVINTISKSTSQWVTSLTISTTISDNQSKIIAYAVNKTSSEASVSWTSITEVTSRSISYTVTANGTYYIWAKDKAGNVSYKSIIINNIGTLKTVSFSTDDLSSSSYSGSYNTGSTIKAINSITVNNGTVGSYSYSGTRIYYSLSGGTRRSGSYSTTCSTSASSTSKISNTYCASYSCPNGGSLSGSTCSGSTLKIIEGGCTWKCVNGNITNWSCTDKGCPDGYSKGEWACGSPSCPNTSVFCANACYKSYSYTATCNSKTEYYCPSGYEEVGSSCYKCSKGSLSGTSCHYSCTESYTYYWYRVDVEYII